MAKITRNDTGSVSTRLSLTDPLTGRRVQRRVTAPTKRALDNEVARIRAEWNSGAWIEPDKTTVAEWCATWHSTYKAAPASRYKRGRIIHSNIASDPIGKIPLTRLRYSHCQDWVDRLVMAGLAPATVRSITSTLSMALTQAVRRQLIASNPCDHLDLPATGRRRWCVLDAEQARRIVTDTRDDPLHAAWVLATTVGVRRGELMALTWSDVDLSAGTLRVERTMTLNADGKRIAGGEAKTESSRRTIRLPLVAIDALRYHRARQNERRLAAGDMWIDSGIVFDGGLGERFPFNGIATTFRAMKERLGLPAELRVHDLRHTAISHMLTIGVPVTAIAHMAGHSNPAVTLRTYSHIVKGLEDTAAERIDDLFRENRDTQGTGTDE